MTLKREKEISSKIDKLTIFYNALSDDNQMNYFIEESDKLHSLLASLATEITLLKEELAAFTIMFDDSISKTNLNVESIKQTSIKKVDEAVASLTKEDIKNITQELYSLKNEGSIKIKSIISQSMAKLKKQTKQVRELKIENNKFNIIGSLLIATSFLLALLSLQYYENMSSYQEKLQILEKNLAQNRKNIYFLKDESDDRYKKTVHAFRSFIEKE